MLKKGSTIGEIATTLLIILTLLGVIGGGAYLVKPELFSRESARANASAQATKKVDDSVKKASANAAAGVTKIGEANAVAPESPAKDFIGREVPNVLSQLEAPDPIALVAAEARKTAVMQGKFELADSLYQKEAKEVKELQTKLAEAKLDRQNVDRALSEAASEHAGAQRNQVILLVIALVLGALWGYSKVFGITPSTMGKMMADMRSGVPYTQAFDTNLAPWLHSSVNKAARLATPSQ